MRNLNCVGAILLRNIGHIVTSDRGFRFLSKTFAVLLRDYLFSEKLIMALLGQTVLDVQFSGHGQKHKIHVFNGTLTR